MAPSVIVTKWKIAPSFHPNRKYVKGFVHHAIDEDTYPKNLPVIFNIPQDSLCEKGLIVEANNGGEFVLLGEPDV